MEQIYNENYERMENSQGAIKDYVNNVPVKQLSYFFIIVFLVIAYSAWTNKIPWDYVWWAIGIMGFVIIILASQNKNLNAHIQSGEAKALVMRDLYLLKRSDTREFDGLRGTYEPHGPCNLDNNDPNQNKWVWHIGWRHILPGGLTKYYHATVLSKRGIQMVKSLSDIGIRYFGEDSYQNSGSPIMQPRQINYYVPSQQPPIKPFG